LKNVSNKNQNKYFLQQAQTEQIMLDFLSAYIPKQVMKPKGYIAALVMLI